MHLTGLRGLFFAQSLAIRPCFPHSQGGSASDLHTNATAAAFPDEGHAALLFPSPSIYLRAQNQQALCMPGLTQRGIQKEGCRCQSSLLRCQEVTGQAVCKSYL